MRRFYATDINVLRGWYVAHKQSPPTLYMLPEYGLIEPEVAAGFVYLTDAPDLCLLDGFVTNPQAPLRKRSQALSLIASSLLQYARAKGARQVMALCKSRGIERLSTQFGLRPVGVYALSVGSLSSDS